MLTHCNRPKVGIKLLKISYVRILFLVSLLFVEVINPYLIILNFQFLNILVIKHFDAKIFLDKRMFISHSTVLYMYIATYVHIS